MTMRGGIREALDMDSRRKSPNALGWGAACGSVCRIVEHVERNGIDSILPGTRGSRTTALAWSAA